MPEAIVEVFEAIGPFVALPFRVNHQKVPRGAHFERRSKFLDEFPTHLIRGVSDELGAGFGGILGLPRVELVRLPVAGQQ